MFIIYRIRYTYIVVYKIFVKLQNTMMNMQDSQIIIIGGGLIGLVSAINLQRSGMKVVIINDQQHPASWGNAGHIAIEQVTPLSNKYNALTGYKRLFPFGGALDIGWNFPKLWLPWFAKYLKSSFSKKSVQEGEEALKRILSYAVVAWHNLLVYLGQQDLLITKGHYVIYHNKQKASQGSQVWLNADIGNAKVRPMDYQTLDNISNHLSTYPVQGLCFEHTGQIKNISRLINVCKDYFIQQGGQYYDDHVISLSPENKKIKITLKNYQAFTHEKVLICAGARSGILLKGMGEYFPVIAERGYHIEWENDGSYNLPPLVFEDHSFIVTCFEKRLRLASFVEFTKFDAQPDVRKWEKLEHYAKKFGLSQKSEFQRWFGSRPTMPDYRPVIGKSTKNPGLFYAFGHQHLGLTLAAITGEIVTDIVLNKTSSLSISAFRPNRF